MASTTIESGLEVHEDANNFPEACLPDTEQKEAAFSRGCSYGPVPIEHHGALEPQKPTQRLRICGLTPLFFGALISLTTALIVGGAVGGGLGSALASQATGTVTVTQTLSAPTATAASSLQTAPNGTLLNYTAPLPTTITSLYLPCPAVDGNTYTTTNGQTWAVSCTVDEYVGDIGSVLAYSYGDCIEACAAMNAWQGVKDVCSRVHFSAFVAESFGEGWGNCWLKNGSAVTKGAGSGDLSAKLMGE